MTTDIQRDTTWLYLEGGAAPRHYASFHIEFRENEIFQFRLRDECHQWLVILTPGKGRGSETVTLAIKAELRAQRQETGSLR